MNRAVISIFVLATASFALAQSSTAPTSGAPTSSTQNSSAPASPAGTTPAQGANAQGSATQGAAAPAATGTSNKGQPQAKSQEEFKAYQDVVGKPDTATMETAADEFAKKYPNSELRTVIYNAMLNTYRTNGASDRAIAVGRKSLAIDNTDPVPNVLVALALAQTTKDSDLDKDTRWNEAITDAQRAIDNVNTGMVVPPNTAPDKVTAAKNNILEMSYETIGTVNMQKKDFAAAEAAFRKGLEVGQAQPDGVLYLRLAVALDNQKKYPEALTAIDNAIKYAQPNSEAANLATQERARLQKLSGAGNPANSTIPPAQ